MPTTLMLGPYRFSFFSGDCAEPVTLIFGVSIVKQNSGWIRSCWQTIMVFGVIFWPQLDEEASVRGMLLGRKSGESTQSLQRWLSARESLIAV